MKTTIQQPFAAFYKFLCLQAESKRFVVLNKLTSFTGFDQLVLHLQVTQSLWLGAQDRTNNLNLEALEEMFHMEEKEKQLPSGKTVSLGHTDAPHSSTTHELM